MRTSFAALGLCVAVAAGGSGSALAQQSNSQLESTMPVAPPMPRPKGSVTPPPPKKEAAPAEASAPAAAKCSKFETGRTAIYAAVIKTVLPELPDKTQAGDASNFQADLEQIYLKYETLAKTGDVQALRKMMAIEIFVAQIRRKDAGELTLRKACALGKLPVKQRQISDPLSCAVMSLEGERRQDEASRERAKTMMANAKETIPETANAATPGKILYEDVVRGLEGCY